MKLNAETQEVESEGFTSTGFSLEVDDPQIIEILTQKIYTDPFIFPRELMANAIDSGGIYELILPDPLNPQWEVEDKGDGMTHEFMSTKYTKIFHSTKRKDNDNIGGFGHGRLSPLAYTDSYNVRSRFKGADGTIMEGNYVVYRGPNKIPMITCASMSRSEVQETGVRVSVPIANGDIQKLSEKSTFFAQYLKPTPPGVKAVKYEFQDVHGGIRSLQDTRSHYGRPQSNEHIPGVRLVIGGVPYPCPANIGGANELAVDLFFGIGELDVTLSRDAVNNTTAANQLITNRFKSLIEAYNAHIKAEIEKQPTLFERYEKWNALYNNAGSSFRNTFMRGIEVAHKLPIEEVMNVAKKDFAIHMLISDVDRNQWDGMDNVTKSYRSLTGLRIFMLNDKCDIERRDGRTSTNPIDFRNILTRYGVAGNPLDSMKVFAVPMPYTTGQIKKIKEAISTVLGAERDKNPSKVLNVMLIQYQDKADVAAIMSKIVSNAKVNYIDTGAASAKLARYVPVFYSDASTSWSLKKKALTDKAMEQMGSECLYILKDSTSSERSWADVAYMVANSFPNMLKGKTVLVLNQADSKYLSSKAVPFKDKLIETIKNDYGYDYTSGLFDGNDVRNAEMRRESAFALLTHRVRGANGTGGNTVLVDKLLKEQGLMTAKPDLKPLFEEVSSIYSKSNQQSSTQNPTQKYRAMLETIISLRDRYKFITKDELPAPTKTVTQTQATVQKDDLAAFLVKYKLLEHLAQDYNTRYYGYDAGFYKAIVEYLTKI